MARLDRAERGVGGLVLLSGEPGIGKTALAGWAAVEARGRGFDVGWSTCWQTAAVEPLRPWTQLLSQLEQPGIEVPDLTVMVGDPDSNRTEQADRVTAWLRRRSRAPMLVVIDDLHWGDAGTLSVLDRVASVLATMPVVVIGAHRPLAPGAVSPLAESVVELHRRGVGLELGGLDETATGELVAGVAGRTASEAACRSIVEITGGNPLFTRELGRALPAAAFDQEIDLEHVTVPPTLQAIVADRLSALGPECREVLATLSVAGDEVPVDLLAAACELARQEALDLVDEASRAGLVDVATDRVGFRHALFRAAVYDAMSSAAKARLHDRLGRELLARRERGLTVDTAALAHHFGRSAPLGNTARAFDFALEAARDACALVSFDVAARRYEQALAILGLDAGLGDRRSVKLDLADALVAAGDFARARLVFREVAVEAGRDGDSRSLGRAALGFSGGMGGIEVLIGDPDVCELLTAASVALDADDVLGARVQARLSIALSYTAPLTERARIALRARDRALAGGDPVAGAEALAAWCDVVAGPDHVEDRRAAAMAVIERSRAIRDSRLEALGQRLLIEALFEAGDLVAAETEIARYERTAARLGRPEYGWYPALWRGSLALARGQMDARARFAAQLDVLVGEASGTNAELLAKAQRGSMAFDLADPDLARQSLVEVESMGGTVEEVQLAITKILLGVIGGDLDRAANLDRCADTALGADRDSEWPGMMMQLADVIVAVGGHAVAPRVLEALAPYGSVWAIEGIGAGIRGPLHRVAGSLAALAGDEDAAESHFMAAHQAATSAGAHLLAALVDHDAGRALGDRLRLEHAADAWRSIGATHRLAQIEALIDGPRARPVAAARSRDRFVREGDVWSITFDGATCTLADRKGLWDLARLIAEPAREIASLDLASPSGGTVVQHDVGEVIDATARDAYRKRLAEIDAELDEADQHADTARSTRLVEERDALIEQLTGAYGLGGRTRRTGTTAERARTAVRSRIRDAMRRIEAAHPALGRHLSRSIRTGTFCVYQPDHPVNWELRDPSHTV